MDGVDVGLLYPLGGAVARPVEDVDCTRKRDRFGAGFGPLVHFLHNFGHNAGGALRVTSNDFIHSYGQWPQVINER